MTNLKPIATGRKCPHCESFLKVYKGPNSITSDPQR